MIPYMNVGYEDNRFGAFTEEEYNMPRIFLYKDNRYHFLDKDIIFDNKYALKIWMNLNGYTIYRAYIYAESIINKYMEFPYDNLKCQLFLCRK